ncbi:MAG TPA: GNAT family N-acetyltransferase [Mesorhizobium sp.]|jgi:ribosomal protein S18 acetylase RimI-like enzyme|nr:GNAT family N-acetyltransferase [Mesorhizobium sp.]
MGSVTVAPARSGTEVEAFRELLREYVDWLSRDHSIDLGFQGVEEELCSLPGKYAPPEGEMLLAYSVEGLPLGCIAVRRFEDQICEIKRLYVRKEARGMGVGQKLAAEILKVAKDLGYTKAILDTGSFMDAAQRLYEKAGFSDIPPYYQNPVAGIRYLGRDL